LGDDGNMPEDPCAEKFLVQIAIFSFEDLRKFVIRVQRLFPDIAVTCSRGFRLERGLSDRNEPFASVMDNTFPQLEDPDVCHCR
jgi:hypothetical protein